MELVVKFCIPVLETRKTDTRREKSLSCTLLVSGMCGEPPELYFLPTVLFSVPVTALR
jgi:hypothetical protein